MFSPSDAVGVIQNIYTQKKEFLVSFQQYQKSAAKGYVK